MPFVIKPAVGFFSMGVHKVSNRQEWERVSQAIQAEMQGLRSLYPEEVLDASQFIIEECIEGTEFAVDLYYDHAGRPVILDILQHLFASDADVSDRVYITSKSIVRRNMEKLAGLLAEIGELAGLRNFPAHAEVRIDEQGNMTPIEVNPMRFGGWCATDIVALHAYGINPYESYFQGKKPDWEHLLAGPEEQIYSLIVLDAPKDVALETVERFDYEQLLAGFEKPLTLRKIDWREYPVFGFLFTETRPDNMAELEAILRSDLKEFMR